MLAARRPPKHEYYLAILNDRSQGGPALVTSSKGGMNIEDVAKDDPSAIITTPIDFEKGLSTEEYVSLNLLRQNISLLLLQSQRRCQATRLWLRETARAGRQYNAKSLQTLQGEGRYAGGNQPARRD